MKLTTTPDHQTRLGGMIRAEALGCGDPLDWHEIARRYVARMCADVVSLDEFLLTHGDLLTQAEYDEGQQILRQFSGYGGEA
ncbi:MULTISPECIES: hypothetical protein [unclassified Mameliella]|uniref:hypothetical protein n=1 Tax=Mameliella sp. LZ-28 TaxID=2484146 RepID=UPI00143FAB59|nr:hypothetical protein [Mameliella sp. LZ-28]MCR9276235.1 hypothetical protein [Paracoccaceae bacterium]